jgi:hypothetical protein
MTAEADFWACRVCRSINSQRADRCYRCHTPREAAAVKPTDMPTTGSLPKLEHTAVYRSTEAFAVGVTLATAVFILSGLLTFWTAYSVGTLRAERHLADANALLSERALLIGATPVLAAVTLLAYAAWISRVVANLPAVGVGWSRVSPTMAFVEPLIPGFNLYAVPARVAEVIRKVDEHSSAIPLLGLGWILVVVPPIAAGLILRFTLVIEATDELFRTAGFAFFLAFVIEATGLGIGLFVLWQVERLMRGRAESGPVARAEMPSER